MCAAVDYNGKMVQTENGLKVRFTKRGKVDNRGFVRIAGRTVVGDVTSDGYFYADFDRANATLAMY